MNTSPRSVKRPVLRSLPSGLAIMAVVLAMLFWLYRNAESVSEEQHLAYVQNLRDLRELDAKINGELLASRLELTRNYDALTTYDRDIQATIGLTQTPPDFLAREDQAEISQSVLALRTELAQRSTMIDDFKRNNAVLHNSLAFFPVVAADILDGSAAYTLTSRVRLLVDGYVRQVMTFSRVPSDTGQARILAIRRQIADLLPPDTRQRNLTTLLLHGDVITARMTELDRQTQSILDLQGNVLLESLNRQYSIGYENARSRAGWYRLALYALVVLLAAFLARTFARLNHTRRSLEVAHDELGERYAAQLNVEKQLMLHATAFRSAHDGITLTDSQGTILDVNPAFTRITGYSREEAIGHNPRLLKSGRHEPGFYEEMWKSIRETGNWRGEIWNRNKSGEIYPELLSISAVYDDSGRLTNYVAVFADITRIKAQETQLTRMAYYDALTALPNRALLADRLAQGIAQTRRTQTRMAICYLDLDGFKPINDNWGHETGDQVLVEMSQRLKDALRGGDTVARLGGDEFVILLLGLVGPEECDEAMTRLLKLIARPLGCLPEPGALSASIGVTLFPPDNTDPDTLLRHADQAMYQAKQAGKNRYQVFDAESDRTARSRHDRVARIGLALENHEFQLYFQPKVNMRKGEVVGVEALIRWNHPELGLVPPLDFLPYIEDHDLIKLVGDWVIEAALTHMETWRAAGLSLPVSVNIAGKQLQAPGFLEKLRVALFLHPEVAGQLELEVLETSALEDVNKTSRIIDECRHLGVSFALDDFGTGYSSLTYLKRLPAETIKIDQSFVRDILNEPNSLVIVQGVIGLTRAFQRQIIAEGVETADHGRLLMQLNCDLAQGHGIAKPMPADAILDWTRTWQTDPRWWEIRNLAWDDVDYPMLVAEVEHRHWIMQLMHALQDGLPSSGPSSVTEIPACRFGHWYYGLGKSRHGLNPDFIQIEPVHTRVHTLAAEVNQCQRDGQIEQARLLTDDLMSTCDKLLVGLQALQRSTAVSRAIH